MRGELLPVWSEMWLHVWEPLNEDTDAPPDMFSELYRELAQHLIAPISVEALADTANDPVCALEAFRSFKPSIVLDELGLMSFLESAFEILEDIGGDLLSNRYFLLLQGFLNRYNLRYDLRRPCVLCPTLPGIFARLMHEVREYASADADLHSLLCDFDESIRDLRRDPSDVKLRTCMARQVVLLEGIALRHPGVNTNTFGRACDQIKSWPHEAVRESVKRMYTFTNDYPGIRHAGTPSRATRPIDMRDLVAVSVILAGFSPYLADGLSPGAGYDVR